MEAAEQWQAWDADHLWHPFTPMSAHRAERPPVIVAADGFELIDAEGKRYLDGTSSLWCNVHGHRVPAIDDAIRGQLDHVAHSTLLGLGSVPAIELARELAVRCPGTLDKVFLSDSGATAVEAALKIAFQYHVQKPGGPERRDLFVALDDGYHGDTLGAVSVGGVALFHRVYQPLLFPSLKVPAPHAYRVPAGHTRESYLEHCVAELERTIRQNAERIAAVILEPLIQGAAGMLVHPPGYLRRVRELTQEHGILLIADEVATGCGRTGTFLACEQEGVVPDVLCLAKGLTGGYLPVAATVARSEIYDAFLGDPGELRTFFHGHTYGGNALGCAAALASLRLMDETNLLEHVRQSSEHLSRRLAEVADHPHVGDIRQMGLMAGIELVRDRAAREPFPYGDRVGHQVILAARRRGVLLRPLGNVLVLMPPLALPTRELDRLCDVAFASIDEVMQRVV